MVRASLSTDMTLYRDPGLCLTVKKSQSSESPSWHWMETNLSTSEISLSWVMANGRVRLCKSWRDLKASEVLAPMEVKNWLNSSATSFNSPMYTCCVVSQWGMELLITFYLNKVLWVHSSSLCMYTGSILFPPLLAWSSLLHMNHSITSNLKAYQSGDHVLISYLC